MEINSVNYIHSFFPNTKLDFMWCPCDLSKFSVLCVDLEVLCLHCYGQVGWWGFGGRLAAALEGEMKGWMDGKRGALKNRGRDQVKEYYNGITLF